MAIMAELAELIGGRDQYTLILETIVL